MKDFLLNLFGVLAGTIKLLIGASWIMLEPIFRLLLLTTSSLMFLICLVLAVTIGVDQFPFWKFILIAIGLNIIYILLVGFASLFIKLPKYDRFNRY